MLSRVRLSATLWTVAHWASMSMGFSRQEYWSGLPFPPPGDLPDPGIKPLFPALEGRFFTTVPPGKLVNLVDGDKDSLLDQLDLYSSEFFFN